MIAWVKIKHCLSTSNTAAAVNPDYAYVKVQQKNEYLYLAKNLMSCLKGEYQLIEELTGKEITEALLDRIFSRFCIGK